MKLQRASGILMPIFSLPGREGIGTLGQAAHEFAAVLQRAGQSVWQILPCGPVCGHLDYSPYASPSTFAGNIDWIDLETLAGEGWLEPGELPAPPPPADFIDYATVLQEKIPLLHRAAGRFLQNASPAQADEFRRFREQSAHWLDDYALFSAFVEHFGTHDWTAWPAEIAGREPQALTYWRQRLAEPIERHCWLQAVFFRQWREWKGHCNRLGIRLIGDIPVYVTTASADVWANPEIFQLHPTTHRPTAVAGVPPDYFSVDGQRWGNPLYRWWENSKTLYGPTVGWWLKRIRHLLKMVDFLRIDHFRGFESYWAIPASEPTAVNGQWRKGPGAEFFHNMRQKMGDLPLIAEDLGVITPEVEALRDEFGLPGMKILQFAFDGDAANPYLPHNFTSPNCLVYTGTHDNNTSNGWFYGPETREEEKQYTLDYLGVSHRHEFHWQLIRLAQSSTAALAIFPLQDILGFAGEFRLNTPGKSSGNWRWKLVPGRLSEEILQRLHSLTLLYGRLPAQTNV